MMKFTFSVMFTLFAVAVANECPVYLADHRDIIGMDTEQRGGGGGWEFDNSLQGYAGSGYLVYKRDSSFGGTEGKPKNMGDKRIKTYFFKVNTPGMYRVVVKSAAPHVTEHNDMWMSLPESGAYMRRHGVMKNLTWALDRNIDWMQWVGPEHWFKVYQNSGGLKWDWGGKTVDFNGHDIITRELKADGTWYSVRMCGRSTQFNVDRISVYLCEGDSCSNGSQRFNEATNYFGSAQSQCQVPAPLSTAPTSTPMAEEEDGVGFV